MNSLPHLVPRCSMRLVAILLFSAAAVACSGEAPPSQSVSPVSTQAVINPIGGSTIWGVTAEHRLTLTAPLRNLGTNHVWTPGDFDADGVPDLFRYDTDTGFGDVWDLSATGFLHLKGGRPFYGQRQLFSAGRFSGSPGTELIQYNYQTGLMLLRRYRVTDGGMDNVTNPIDVGNEAKVIVGDFDGDSRDDLFIYRIETGAGAVWTYDSGLANFKAAGVPFAYYPHLKWTVGSFQESGRKQLLSMDPMRRTIRLFSFSASEGQMKPSGIEGSTRSSGDSVIVAANFDSDVLDEAFEFDPTTGAGVVRKIRHLDGVLDNQTTTLSYAASLGARHTDFLRVRPPGSSVDALVAYQKQTGRAKVMQYSNGQLTADDPGADFGAQLSVATWQDGAGASRVFTYRSDNGPRCSLESCNDGDSATVDTCAPEGCVHRYAAPTNLAVEKVTPFSDLIDAKHSFVGGISNAGVVVGTAAIHVRSDIPDYYESRAFRFTPPSTFQMLEPGPFSGPALTDGTRFFNSGIPALNTSVNEAGQMALSVMLTWDGWYGIARDGAGKTWNDQMIAVGYAAGINARGDVAATTVTPDGQHPEHPHQAVRWTETGGVTSLGNLGSVARIFSGASDIADDGTVVGTAWIPSTTNASPWYAQGHAFIALPGEQMVDLNTYVDPASGWELTQANGISSNGRFVVGLGLNTNAPSGQTIRAFRYDRDTGLFKDLGESPQDGIAWAYGVNNYGDVVGSGSFIPGAEQHGFVFTDDYGMLNLQAVLPAGSNWRLYEAKAINDSRVILAHANQNDNKQEILKLQLPKPACSANSGLPPSLVVNGSFECDLNGWNLGRWDAATSAYVKGGLHMQTTLGAYGKGHALRVTVGPADAGVVTPDGYPAGASVKLKSFPASRWVSIEFDARRADPNGASALQVDPGAAGERWVTLSDTWEHHQLSFVYHGSPEEIFFYLTATAAPWPRTPLPGSFEIDNVVLRDLPDCGATVVGQQQDSYDCNIPSDQLGKPDYKISYEVRSLDGEQAFAVTRPIGYTMGSVIQTIGSEWRSLSTNVRFRNQVETQEGMLSFRVVARPNINLSLPTGRGRFEIRNVAFAPATCTQAPSLSSIVMNEDFACDISYWHPFVHGHGGANPRGLHAAQSQLIELAHSQEDSKGGSGSLQVTQLPGIENPVEFHTHTSGAATWLRADIAKDEKIRFSYDAKLLSDAGGASWLRLARPWGGIGEGTATKLSDSWQHFEQVITEGYGSSWYHFVLAASASPEIAMPAAGTFLLDNVKIERVVACGTGGSEGLACDDGNACTVNDRCMASVCGGAPRSCDDGDDCTTDSCEAGVCVHGQAPAGASCCSALVAGTALPRAGEGLVYAEGSERCGTAMESTSTGREATYVQDEAWSHCVPDAGARVISLANVPVRSSWFSPIAVSAGETYCVSVALRWGSTGKPYLALVPIDVAGTEGAAVNLIGGEGGIPVQPGPPVWRYYAQPFAATADMRAVRVEVGTQPDATQADAAPSAADDLQVVKGQCRLEL